MSRRAAVLCWVLLAVGCSSQSHELVIDLRTDLRPGFDFVSVRTTIVGAADPTNEGNQATLAVAVDDDFVTGQRIAELDGLSPGAHELRVELLDRGAAVVARRRVSTEVSGLRSLTLVITSDCFGVSCPGLSDPTDATECASGRCVSPECTDETPEACGVGGCVEDADCAAGVACASARCAGGACFRTPDDSSCPAGTYCDITDGCTALPPMDAGAPPPSDAGPGGVDAGPPGVDAGGCTPAACDDFDPCTIDGCGPFGCTNVPRCGAGEYCEAGTCQLLPSITIDTNDGFACADLGRDHTAPSDYLWRRTVRGRAGASWTQFNRHVGCAEATMEAETDSLDSSGTHTYQSNDGVNDDCGSPVLGRFAVYVEVDGRRSDTIEVTYFNSSCPGVTSCTAARSFCPPCRDCDPSNEYCYDDSECAPDPTLVLEGGDGAGCADLGTAHAAPAFLWRRTVTGRPGATAQQFNEHVSCGDPPAAAEAIALGPSGSDTIEATNGAETDCTAPFLGRYRVYVEVDGVRSATRELTYYNSSCPGIDTCAAARTHCPG